MNEKKKRLRKEILERRDSIPSEVRKEKDRAIQERFAGLEAYRNAKAVMLFAPFRSEVDTTGIIIDALKSDKKVILPKVDTAEKRLRLYVIKGMEELKPGCMGIPEPDVSSEREVTAEDADFIMMPGVAFDERCGRLGYGGAYYDRLLGSLKKRPPLVAVAYEEQVVEDVPVVDHDVRVDMIVTDKRVINGKESDSSATDVG